MAPSNENPSTAGRDRNPIRRGQLACVLVLVAQCASPLLIGAFRPHDVLSGVELSVIAEVLLMSPAYAACQATAVAKGYRWGIVVALYVAGVFAAGMLTGSAIALVLALGLPEVPVVTPRRRHVAEVFE